MGDKNLCFSSTVVNETVKFALQVLCALLEFEIIESSDSKMQIITTLQSTTVGKRMYAQLCERQIALRELVSSHSNKKRLPMKAVGKILSATTLNQSSFKHEVEHYFIAATKRWAQEADPSI